MRHPLGYTGREGYYISEFRLAVLQNSGAFLRLAVCVRRL